MPYTSTGKSQPVMRSRSTDSREHSLVSPHLHFFLLGSLIYITHNLDSWKDRYPTVVKELQDGLYVDDLMAGGVTVDETSKKKAKAMEVFEDATFSIHKWHYNAKELEGNGETPPESDDEGTYVKQQLGGGDCIGGKLLGLPWDREKDTFSVDLNVVDDGTTKRDVLSQIAKVYDPLGLVSPTTIDGKVTLSGHLRRQIILGHGIASTPPKAMERLERRITKGIHSALTIDTLS